MKVDRATSFRHENDCREAGCPRHVVTLRYHTVSNVYELLMDEESYCHFDPECLHALRYLFDQAEPAR